MKSMVWYLIEFLVVSAVYRHKDKNKNLIGIP